MGQLPGIMMLIINESPTSSPVPWSPQACWYNQGLKDCWKLRSDKANLTSQRDNPQCGCHCIKGSLNVAP